MKLPKRTCKQCDGPVSLQFQKRNGKLELMLPRNFCSDRCKGLSKGGYSKQAYSIKARAHLGDRCDACGTTDGLVIHHIDQDNSNNVKANLQTLCKTCHDFWHSLAKRIDREIAGRMPRLIEDPAQ